MRPPFHTFIIALFGAAAVPSVTAQPGVDCPTYISNENCGCNLVTDAVLAENLLCEVISETDESVIVVKGDDLELDLNGYRIFDSNGTALAAITNGQPVSNFQVYNGEIEGFFIGILLSNVFRLGFGDEPEALFNWTISDIRFVKCNAGIAVFDDAKNIVIEDSEFVGNLGRGVAFGSTADQTMFPDTFADNGIVRRCVFESNFSGIGVFRGAPDAVLTDNCFDDNEEDIILDDLSLDTKVLETPVTFTEKFGCFFCPNILGTYVGEDCMGSTSTKGSKKKSSSSKRGSKNSGISKSSKKSVKGESSDLRTTIGEIEDLEAGVNSTSIEKEKGEKGEPAAVTTWEAMVERMSGNERMMQIFGLSP